jgi:hypothetical protein
MHLAVLNAHLCASNQLCTLVLVELLGTSLMSFLLIDLAELEIYLQWVMKFMSILLLIPLVILTISVLIPNLHDAAR